MTASASCRRCSPTAASRCCLRCITSRRASRCSSCGCPTGRLHRSIRRSASISSIPTFRPTGVTCAFVLTSNSPQSVLVIRDRTAQTESRYAPREARGTVRNPKLDLHHGRIVFTVSDPGGQQIAAVDLQGQNLTLLTQSVGTNGWSAVSPDGGQIAFTSSRDGSLQIYVMSADGDNVRQLTDGPQRNMRPAWSPDGRRLAFTSAVDGNLEVCVMNADGSGVRRIVEHPERDDFPIWHPDGQRLLVVSERSGDCDLYMVEVDPQP